MKSDGILGLAHHYASDRSLRGETFVSTLFRPRTSVVAASPNRSSTELRRKTVMICGERSLVLLRCKPKRKTGAFFVLKFWKLT